MKTVLECNPNRFEKICKELIEEGYQLSSSSCSSTNERVLWCAIFYKPTHAEKIKAIPEAIISDWNLEQHELNLIIKAMYHFKGDKTAVSNALNISVSSLYRKISHLKHTDWGHNNSFLSEAKPTTLN